MWTLTFTQLDHKYEAVFTGEGEGVFTNSSTLEEMIDYLLPITDYVQSTPTGPFGPPDLSVGYLAYAFVGSILSEYFEIDTNWEIQGEGYEWPEETEAQQGSTFSYVDYIRTRNGLKRLSEFYNQCHDENGQFCEAHGSAVRHFGFEDWPTDRVKTILTTVKRLQDRYGIVVTVNAQDNDMNIATQVEALAAVDDAAPRTIDIHPSMKDQKWLEDNIPEAGTMVSGPDLEKIVIHEYGHILELEFNATKGASERLDLLEPFKVAQQSYDDMVFGTGKGGAYQELTKTVSPYAGEDMQEGIAESFLQHELGIQNKYSDHVGLHFNNLIGGKRHDYSN